MTESASYPRTWGTSLQAKILGFVLVCVIVPVLAMGGYLLKRNEEILTDKVR